MAGPPSGDGDVDALAVTQAALDALEGHHAIHEGEQGVIGAAAHIEAGQDGGAALADQDRTGGHALTAIALDAEALGVGVAAVARGACAFLVGHGNEGKREGRDVRSKPASSLVPGAVVGSQLIPAQGQGSGAAAASGDGLAVQLDRLNHHPGELLTMTVLATRLLLGTHLVDHHLGTAAVGHHLELHSGACDERLTQGGALGVLQQQHRLEGDGLTLLGVDAVEVDVAIGLQPELLAGGGNDGVGAGCRSGRFGGGGHRR